MRLSTLKRGFACLLVAMGLPVAAHATISNFQGFETDTGDWTPNNGNSSTITRVASGGGSLHLTPSSGSYYAEITNADDASGYSGFGDSLYSFYGGYNNTYPGKFYQSVDVYINTAWAPTSDTADPVFWLDMSPTVAGDPSGNSLYGDEHNFRLYVTGNGQVGVGTDGGSTFATITQSGWYTFAITYATGATPSSLINNEMYVFNSSSVVGKVAVTSDSPGGPSPSSQLGGNGYVWFTNQQDGFDNDLLGIDNVNTNVGAPPLPASVPEPASLAAVGVLGVAGLLMVRRRRVSC